jgi:hypothetical protein
MLVDGIGHFSGHHSLLAASLRNTGPPKGEPLERAQEAVEIRPREGMTVVRYNNLRNTPVKSFDRLATEISTAMNRYIAFSYFMPDRSIDGAAR